MDVDMNMEIGKVHELTRRFEWVGGFCCVTLSRYIIYSHSPMRP